MAQNEKHKITLSSTPKFTIKLLILRAKLYMHAYFTHCPALLKKSNKVHTLNSTARQESKTVGIVNFHRLAAGRKEEKYAANL